jgi:glycosyltransferase involved in cell wall biosynthesis
MKMTEKKPLITFALFAYNQVQYIEEAVLGAFSQTYSPLEIVLSDDCSPDNTFEIMKKMAKEYKGPHKIILNRNQNNLGLIGHINKVFLEIAKGEIIVVAAGDDISLPDRVKKTCEAFNKNKEVTTVSVNFININENGKELKTKTNSIPKSYSLNDFCKKIEIPLLGFSRAYKKKISKTFDELEHTCGVEDSNLVFRSILLGESYHIDEVEVKYRRLKNSLSSGINGEKYRGIIKQRLKDLNKAKELNLINLVNFKCVLDSVNSSKKKHVHIDKLFSSRNKLYYFLKNILFNKDFRRNEKKNYLKFILKNLMQ